METVGGIYMVACGVPEPMEDNAVHVGALALHMVKSVELERPDHKIKIGKVGSNLRIKIRARQHNFLFPQGNKTSFINHKCFIFVS